jgi:hypothetical protein
MMMKSPTKKAEKILASIDLDAVYNFNDENFWAGVEYFVDNLPDDLTRDEICYIDSNLRDAILEKHFNLM